MVITNNTCNWIRLSVETYGFPLDSGLVEFICLCSARQENTPKNYLPTHYFCSFSVRMSLEVSHKCSVSSIYKSVPPGKRNSEVTLVPLAIHELELTLKSPSSQIPSKKILASLYKSLPIVDEMYSLHRGIGARPRQWSFLWEVFSWLCSLWEREASRQTSKGLEGDQELQVTR